MNKAPLCKIQGSFCQSNWFMRLFEPVKKKIYWQQMFFLFFCFLLLLLFFKRLRGRKVLLIWRMIHETWLICFNTNHTQIEPSRLTDLFNIKNHISKKHKHLFDQQLRRPLSPCGVCILRHGDVRPVCGNVRAVTVTAAAAPAAMTVHVPDGALAWL